MSAIFEAIDSQSAQTPEVFDFFCYEFRVLAKKKPYGSLILQWLNKLEQTENLEAPSWESISAARLLLCRNLESLLQSIDREFEIAVARIDGFLRGLSTFCSGMNYVPKYRAMACPQWADEISVNIQAQVLVKLSEYDYSEYRGCSCSDFQRIRDWQIALKNSLEQWIVKRFRVGSKNIELEREGICGFNQIFARLVQLIQEALTFNPPEVWKFKIGYGYDYLWGIDNESYAFESEDKLFIMTFGWVD